jgi:hypothetical protein
MRALFHIRFHRAESPSASGGSLPSIHSPSSSSMSASTLGSPASVSSISSPLGSPNHSNSSSSSGASSFFSNSESGSLPSIHAHASGKRNAAAPTNAALNQSYRGGAQAVGKMAAAGLARHGFAEQLSPLDDSFGAAGKKVFRGERRWMP